MADEPLKLAALAKFHREVVVPDIARAVQASVDGLRAEMNAGFDAVYRRLDRLLGARLED